MKTAEQIRQLALDHESLAQMVTDKTNELIICNRQLVEEVISRKRMEAEILEITQAEQRRFGSQLHDGLCQELAAILVFAKGLSLKMEKDKTLELTELKKIYDMLFTAAEQARNTARGLYPGELEGNSLMYSLEELTTKLEKNIHCKFECPKPIHIEDNTVATHIYRIAQEGLSNAVEHGKPKNITLSFIRNQDKVVLTITDDGIGMVSKIIDSNGIGLKIMKYRAHMMDAKFEILANKPRGVILQCTIPMPKTKSQTT